jgi:hypothetical protein
VEVRLQDLELIFLRCHGGGGSLEGHKWETAAKILLQHPWQERQGMDQTGNDGNKQKLLSQTYI